MIFNYVQVCVYKWVCAYDCRHLRGPWSWSYRRLRVVRLKLRSSGRIASALNHQTGSPALSAFCLGTLFLRIKTYFGKQLSLDFSQCTFHRHSRCSYPPDSAILHTYSNRGLPATSRYALCPLYFHSMDLGMGSPL